MAGIFGAQPPDGRPQRAWNSQFGAAANATMWALLADSPGGAVLESTSQRWALANPLADPGHAPRRHLGPRRPGRDHRLVQAAGVLTARQDGCR